MIVIDSDSAMIIVLIQTRVSVLYFFLNVYSGQNCAQLEY